MAAMVSPFLLLILSLFFNLITLSLSQPAFLHYVCSPNGNGNYSSTSTYARNLNSIRSSLTSNATDFTNGFFNFSSGDVNSIALCRGDVQPDACRSCLNDSTLALPNICPYQKEAIGWYDNCMFRYSNRSIYRVVENDPNLLMWNLNNVTDVQGFNKALSDVLNSLRTKAAAGSSVRKFALGNTTASDFQTLFALVQCTPDLTELQCSDCLVGAFPVIPDYFNGKQGGRFLKPSCNFRYESYPFYDPSADTPPPSPPSPLSPVFSPPPQSNNTVATEGKKSNATQTAIIIVVSIAVVIVIGIVSICIYLRKRTPKNTVEDVDEISNVDSLQYDFGTIRVGTDNFSDMNKLGQGGFGAVYKGKLPNGQEIAVKRLSKGSGQGDTEFKNEVLLVAKLQHRNLVRLLGFCLERKERLLIYEFVRNASLDQFIFDRVKRAHLDWERRYKIIGGIARGLLYLHEDSRLRIIHRDLKVSNILLDEEMNPKIADFGMAKLFLVDQTQGETSRIVGTYGYMAPEYAMHGNFSVKSDVFSFGVLILEIVSGQKNSSFHNGENAEDLLSYTWRNWREGTALNIADPSVTGGSRTEIMRCIHIGLLCVQENLADRPTMASIVLMLSSYSITLPVPSQPAFFMHSKTLSDISSSAGYDSRMTDPEQSKSKSIEYSKNEASITELYPR